MEAQVKINDAQIMYLRSADVCPKGFRRRIGAVAIGWHQGATAVPWMRVSMSLASKNDHWSRVVARKKTLGRLASKAPDPKLALDIAAGHYPDRLFIGEVLILDLLVKELGLGQHIQRVDRLSGTHALANIYSRVEDMALGLPAKEEV